MLAPALHPRLRMNHDWLHDWLSVGTPAELGPGAAVRVWEGRPVALLRPPYPGPLPPDLKDCTVLHVGCDAGAICLEALRRGAVRAVGVDLDPDRIKLARSYASLAGLAAEFAVMDVQYELPAGRFDVVVCTDLNSHPDPAALLDRLGRITDERLVVEFEGPRSVAARAYLDRIGAPSGGEDLDRWPAILVADDRGTESRSYLSPHAVRRLLATRGARFSSVDVTSIGNRGLHRAVATRRVIRRLVVVAGAGRGEARWIVRRLQRGDAPQELLDAIGLTDGKRWQFAPDSQVEPMGERVTSGLVYGYDLNGAWRRRGGRFGQDELADLIESAAEVMVVTTWAEPQMLLERGRFRVGREALRLRRLERHPVRVLFRSLGALLRKAASAPPWRWSLTRARRFFGVAREELDVASRTVRSRAEVDTHRADERAVRRTDEHLLRYARWLDYCHRADVDGHWIVDTTSQEWRTHRADHWGHLLIERARLAERDRP